MMCLIITSLRLVTPISFIRKPRLQEVFNISEGTIVLNTNWILDSLDAQTFLPRKYYTVIGVTPPRLTWSTIASELSNTDPLSSLKWLLGGFLTTPLRTSSKRQVEDENTEHLRKRQLSMAVDEMEAALSRLREVTANSPIYVVEPCQETVCHDTEDREKDWTDVSDESESKVMECYREFKTEEERVDVEPEIHGKICMVKCQHDKLDCSSVGSESINKVTSDSSFDEYCAEETGDRDMEELEYSRTPESVEEEEGNKEEKIEYFGMNDETDKNDITNNIDEFVDGSEYAPSSEIPETPEIGELEKRSYHGSSEIGIESANAECSFSSFEDDSTSSLFNQSGSSADDFSPVSSSFYAAYQEINSSSQSPYPSPPPKTISASANELSTDKSNPLRASTSIKEESPPNYPLLLNTPITPRFAAELFPQNITPRSPARQARLESQQRVKRLLRDYNFASKTDDEIYLPNLKHTMCKESTTTTARQSDGGTKVWDVKAVDLDAEMVRLIRVGEAICV